VGLGLVFAASGRRRRVGPGDRDMKAAREALLEELAGLDRAHVAGVVGPRTYERARRELLDALARLILVASKQASSS
jgi:hypothetical protein